jgi:hypothetical protein
MVTIPPPAFDWTVIFARWFVVLLPVESIKAVETVRTTQDNGYMVGVGCVQPRDLGPSGLDPNLLGHEAIM